VTPLAIAYVLPLRMADARPRAELARYLADVVAWCGEVIVVDGSEPGLRAGNAAAWPAGVTQVVPDPRHRCLMMKVAGVRTGIERARCEHVVIADDDVRYERAQLERVVALLGAGWDLVRPQNCFDELPWHARWDTARTLLNRSLGADYPGTLAIRRSVFDAIGGYDGDVLFENLELMRTVRAAGGRIASPLDLYVARRPPDAAHFLGQRVRQAYDDFALPARMALWLALAPVAALALARDRRHRRRALAAGAPVSVARGGRRGAGALAAAALLSMALAERGRRRAGGARVFPASCSLLAPAWIAERAVCSWLALVQRMRYGGVRYGDAVIPTAAHSVRQLRRRARAQVPRDAGTGGATDAGAGAAGSSAPLAA
jgi:hypothetical protein